MLINAISDSFEYFRKALQFAKRPELRRYILFPLAINIIVFSSLFYFSIDFVWDFFSSFLNKDFNTGWHSFDNLEWLQSILAILIVIFTFLAGIALLVIMAYAFTSITHLIASPFNGMLVERLDDLYADGKVGEEIPLLSSVKRSLKREFQKISYWLIRALGLLIVHIILYFTPFVIIMPFCWFLLGAWILGLEYFDYIADSRGMMFKDNIALLKNNKWHVLGFGSIMLGLTLIPIVNLVVIPIGIIAATMLWLDKFGH